MTPPKEQHALRAVGSRGAWQEWSLLILLSVVLLAVLTRSGVPAALLLGPMLAGIVIAAGGGSIQMSRYAFIPAQGLIGCLIAKMLPGAVGGAVLAEWPIFLLGVLSVVVVSVLLGWSMTRMRVLPGTTALWGLSPGAASAMTLMAEAYGGDVQLVAFMQYLRVLLVAGSAAILASTLGSTSQDPARVFIWFPPVVWLELVKTLLLALLVPLLATRLKLRAGALLLTIAAGLYLSRHGFMTIDLPPWLLVLGYAVVGWRIGLSFTRASLVHAARLFPRILLCTVALIVLCAALALFLVVFAGVDPLTAYLATSPGGVDSVAIIAASSHVDRPFVMAMQAVRLLAVLALGPALARFIARKSKVA